MRKKILKTGLAAICIILAIYLGIRVAFFMSSPFQSVYTGNELDPIEKNGRDIRINVLLMGLDKDEIRTDTLIFASYSSKDGKCFVLSIPRDTYVNVNGRSMLINSAYYEGGAEMTIKKVKELTGLPINYYVVFTFQDFRDVIDGLGGVEFDVRPQGYHYEDIYQDLYIHIPGGYQVLDGEKAEGLVRFRADYPRADLERVEVQQKFLSALIEQKLNAKAITAVPGIYDDLKDSLKSNISLDEILKYAKQILSSGLTSIDTYTLPVTEYGAHLLPDKAGIDALIEGYFNQSTTENS